MKERYQGPLSRFLGSVFVSKVCYDTKLLLAEDTSLDYRLMPATKSKLSMQLSVSAEVWSDPFSALSGNEFWGQCGETDFVFGGFMPFGNADGNEQFLFKRGGSVLVLTPPDSTLASRYLSRVLDILRAGIAVPLSFAVFLRSDCLVERKSSPSINDIYTLEPRLRDQTDYVVRIETLSEGAHCFFSERFNGPTTSTSSSLFVLLQNPAGKTQFALSDMAASEILGSMKPQIRRPADHNLGTPLAFASEMVHTNDNVFMPQGSYLEPATNLPASPMPHQSAIATDFGAIGRSAPSISNSFGANPSPGQRRVGPRRGRLFDLVDDGEEDNMNDVVLLGSLNVDLFQNPPVQDVDIEAISLMGIGGSPAPNTLQPRSTSQGRFR
jgi:hypothetical protein